MEGYRMKREGTAPLRVADVQLATGVRINYAECGDPAGHPIIMLHGYTDSWLSYSRVLPLLSSAYHAYALSQRGHGDSERPEDGYAMADAAADVDAFMDAMGVARATVVGHSMGSFVAQELALAAPSRVARLVLIGSAADMRSENVFQLGREVEALEDPVPDDFLDLAVAESLKLPARVWRTALAGQLAVDNTARLSRIRMPALVLRGDHDTIFSRAAQEALPAGLPNATSKVYPETGHALHWERPDEFVSDLEEFIASTEPLR